MGCLLYNRLPHSPHLRQQKSEVGDRKGGPEKEQERTCKIKVRTQTCWGPCWGRVNSHRQFPSIISLSSVPTVSLKVYDFLKFYLFTYLLVFMWMGVLLACMYVWIPCMPGAWKGQKRALYLLGLELQMTVRLQREVSESRSFWESSRCPRRAFSSTQSPCFDYP